MTDNRRKIISFAFLFLAMTAVSAQPFTESETRSLLEATTKFYGAQRSGTATDNWLIAQYPVADRKACFPQDGVSYQAGLDLSGGWHDAGDNIKFTLTIAWSAYALLKSYDAFPSAHSDNYDRSYGAPNGIPDILDEVKWATDYLMKVHLDSGKLVSQIGDYRDHNNGLTCPTMTGRSTANGGDPRTVWFGASSSDYTQVKADVLGITSAALALMGKLYAPYDEQYAAQALIHARQLYSAAKSRTGTTAEPANQDYYKDNSYLDDLACAAVELHRATGTTSYLTEAIEYSSQVKTHGWVVDWSTHIDFCRHSIAVSGDEGKTAVQNHWKSAVTSYLGKVSNNEHVRGLAFFSDWGSLRYAMNSAFSAALYYSVYGGDEIRNFALSQLYWVMGENDYDRSFVVGWGNNPPTRPHHKNAFGKDSWFSTNSTPLYSLTGALVGGPHTNDYSDGNLTSPPGYQDIMTDYITNEVTIDYNVGLVGTAAFQLALLRPDIPNSIEVIGNSLRNPSIQRTGTSLLIRNPSDRHLTFQEFDILGHTLDIRKIPPESELIVERPLGSRGKKTIGHLSDGNRPVLSRWID